MTEDETLMRTAIFGQEVELFLKSHIGDFLVKHAQAEADIAAHKLKRVLPWRRRRIQELQNAIRVAEWFQIWLGEAVAQGQQATEILEENASGN
jgi:hypothetical protein